MPATTTEGTGLGSVDNILPRVNTQVIRARDIVDLKEIIRETSPGKVDGANIGALVQALSTIDLTEALLKLDENDMKLIISAAEIIKKILNY